MAEEGVTALRSATPIDTGETAASWDYKIRVSGNSFFYNIYKF